MNVEIRYSWERNKQESYQTEEFAHGLGSYFAPSCMPALKKWIIYPDKIFETCQMVALPVKREDTAPPMSLLPEEEEWLQIMQLRKACKKQADIFLSIFPFLQSSDRDIFFQCCFVSLLWSEAVLWDTGLRAFEWNISHSSPGEKLPHKTGTVWGIEHLLCSIRGLGMLQQTLTVQGQRENSCTAVAS